MNSFVKSMVLLLLCFLCAGKLSHADELETINERLKLLQEKVQALEGLKQEVEALKEELTREVQSRDDQVIALEERMEEAEPLFDIANTLAKTHLGGYFELHYNNAINARSSSKDDVLDFHRFVLYLDHEINDWIKFTSELEVEHAFVEGGEDSGEVELEQAYLDFSLHKNFNVRAGVLLMPIGIINQYHEPPTFNGVERPFVDKYIIPTTWFDSGIGFFGEVIPGLSYQVNIMGGLEAEEFSAKDGLRSGRQKAFKTNAEDLAFVGRLDYKGIPGLQLGATLYRGDSAQDLRIGEDINVTIGEFDFKYRLGNFDFRGEYALVNIDDARELNWALGKTSGKDAIASELQGWYLEGAYHFLRRFIPSAPHDATFFVRYEDFDTQHKMPTGFKRNRAYDRKAWTIGFSYWPTDTVVIKADYQDVDQGGGGADDYFNLGLGWQF
jgi:Phosphate-selective porin O and P